MPQSQAQLNLFGESKSNQIGSLPDTEWVEVEVTVDSGACDTVMPEEVCSHIDVLPSAKSKSGCCYEVANGEELPNVGERQCLAITPGSKLPKRIHFQIAGAHKPLLSVSRCADMGYECV